MKSLSSRTIDWVRFPLVILVLFVHCHAEEFSYAVPVADLAGHSFGEILFSVLAFAMAWFGTAAVPVFFMLSGYLFFLKSPDTWSWDFYKGKLKKRVKTLLIPYILFNVICVISALCCGDPGWRNPDMIPVLGYFWNSTTFCVGMHNWYGLDMQLFYPEVIPLWFVRDLMFMCLVSPVVWVLLKKFPKTTLFVLVFVYISGLWIGANGYNSQALTFFSLGAYFSIHGKDMVEWCYKQVWKFLPVTLVLLAVATYWNSLTQAQQVYHGVYLCGAFLIIGLTALWADRSGKTVRPLLPNCSFFIYALHMCYIGTFSVLDFCPQVLQSILGTPDHFFSAFTEFLIGPWVVAGFCMVIYVVLKKICPQLLSLFTGGR